MFVGALALAACTARVADNTPQQADAPAKTTEAARHLHHPVGVVIDAARSAGNLDAAQAQRLDTIAGELKADSAGRRALREKLRTSVAAVVRSGTADTKAFDRSVSAAVDAFQSRADQSVAALEEIHDILTPAQRAAVAANLRDRVNQRFSERRQGDARHGKGFARAVSALALSALQVQQLQAIKKELLGERKQLRPSRAELLSLVDAFEGEDFSAALETFRGKKMAILRERVAHAGARTDTVLSIFTPQQRDLLADLVVKGPGEVLLGPPAAGTVQQPK